jgi:hypothetical protein
MPIPIEKIQVVEDEILRLNDEEKITSSEQDFSFLNQSSRRNNKRSVHYDIEPINNHEHQPLQTLSENEQPSIDNVLRRRYIAHWGLPGN